MIDRRRIVRLVLTTAVLAVACSPAAPAQENFKRFYPFLIDLTGWTGSKPDGLALEMPGNSMTTAGREYRRGDARINAQVVTGPAAQAALSVTKTGVKLETGDVHMVTSTINGMAVATAYTVHDKSGTVLVALAPSAMFSISFNGLGEDEALVLAKQFDWKGIQAELPK